MHRNGILVSLVAFSLFLAGTRAALGDDGSRALPGDQHVAEAMSRVFSEVAERAVPAVVYVTVESKVQVPSAPGSRFEDWWFEDPFDLFGGNPLERFLEKPRERKEAPPGLQRFQRGQGSGFLIAADGLILTNNHVVNGADRIRVRLHDGRSFSGTLLGADPESDVALVRIEASGLPYLRLADSSALRVGQWVVAVGNPFGLTETITAGIISAKGRTHVGLSDYENYLQTDAAINPGNSGGPLLNLRGEVVGMNAAIYSRSGGYMGIGFAIAANLIKSIQAQLLNGGKVVRGFLGVSVQDLTPDLAAALESSETQGALVAEVTTDSAAAKAGLRAGDIVIAIEGAPVSDSGTLRNEIAARKPGSEVRLEIIRRGARQTLPVRLGERPGAETPAAEGAPIEAALGIEVEALSEAAARRLGLDPDRGGVVIRSVWPGGLGALAGLEAGEVILEVDRKPVTSPEEVRAALRGNEGRILLRVQGQQGTRYVVLRVE